MDDDLDAIRDAAADRCDELAESLLGRPSGRSMREVRWGTHGKLRLKIATARWSDFSTGEWGDIFDLTRRELGCSFSEAAEWVREQLGMPARVRFHERPKPSAADQKPDDRAARARTLYLNARPAGAYGFGYFSGRGLDYPEVLEAQLRCNEVHLGGFMVPERCLLMPFRAFATLEVRGVHKIGLNAFEDGRRVKRSAGEIWGSAMMLGRKGPRLAICEGLETAIGVMMGDPGMPVWALSGASFMAGFGPIEGVEELLIYADNDKAGRDAATTCAGLWHEEGLLVTVVTPDRKGDDFADVYRRPA